MAVPRRDSTEFSIQRVDNRDVGDSGMLVILWLWHLKDVGDNILIEMSLGDTGDF